MALYVETNNPKQLLHSINEEIDSGKIDTWKYDSSGDFTHTAYQWCEKAWFKYYAEENRLVFGIIGRNDEDMSKAVYAVYHGRFAEMLLAHFDTHISQIQVSSLLIKDYDLVRKIPPQR